MDNQPQRLNQQSPSWFGTFKRDFLASIVVFLVALPLCMGIANACGLPPAMGIITGIIGGLVVGFLAGCPLQVSGPAAGLVVTVADIVRDEKLGFAMLGIIILGAGLLQLIAGIGRLGQWFRAVSPAVIEGMLAGIGVLILASQFHVMVDDKPREDGITNLISIPEAVYKGVVPQEHPHHKGESEEAWKVEEVKQVNHRHAAQIGVLTILVLVLWKLLPRRVQLLPAPLMAIVAGTVVCITLNYDVLRVPMPDNLLEEITWPTWETLKRIPEAIVLKAMVTVAFIASAETLLCATAVDQMQQGPRTKYDRELMAQGVGNMLCGLLGALPMTGVIVRSAANVEAGGKTRTSAILHGVWLLLTVLLFSWVLTQVPRACLAAVLVYTGYSLVNYKVVKELWAFGWSEVAIFFCTLIGVVATNLLEGVILGVILSTIKLLYRFSHLQVRLEEDPGNKRTILYLEGAATFLRLPQLASALEKIPKTADLHVHFENLTYIDHACLELLMTWEKQHESLGGTLTIDWHTLHGKFFSGPNGTKTTTESINGQANGHAPEKVEKEKTSAGV